MQFSFKDNQIFRRAFYFFPLQLVFVHLKKSHTLLIFWILLFGFITQNFAVKYGVPDLFLYPEYLGKVNFWSYLIMGFSCGGFIMAYNISSYIINGFRFPFLATLSRPFMKYCLNNSIIPLSFILTYLYYIISFQFQKEFLPLGEVLFNASGFVIGNILFVFLSITYFLSTNKDLFHLFGIKTDDDTKAHIKKINPIKDVFHHNIKWNKKIDHATECTVETYLGYRFKLMLARDCSHYDRNMLAGVFQQNHINAAYFEVLVFVSLLVLGLFREVREFMIPAGATIFLLFTMFLMLTSAFHSWLRGWSTMVFVGLFLLFNFLSGYDFFNYENQVFGVNYYTEKAVYSNETLKKHSNDKEKENNDIAATIEILNKWRIKNSKNTIERQEKPKMVIVCTSGGGLRATLWTFYALQYTDSILKGELLNHTQFITGSSGGLIGASYLRELYLQSQLDSTMYLHDASYKEKIAGDLLNPLSFTIAVNDLFLRLQKFNDGKYIYTKDRGYAFEKQFHENTNYLLNKRLSDYIQPESQALIPMIAFCPTIINDGRRLIVASQPVAYLSGNAPLNNISNETLSECIEFTEFFKKQDAENIHFLSALRMNATFPYILPVTSLPSEPAIEIMDGGIRDNYGIKTALKYIYVFRNWISSNTSGVVIIQTRDKYKEIPVEENPRSALQTMTSPLGSFYGNFDKIQNFNHDELVQYASAWFDGPIDIVDFQLKNDKERKISMSWHLTTKEKMQVLDAINMPENQRAIKKLKKLLE